MHVLVHAPVGSTGGYARDGQGLIHGLLNRKHGVALDPAGMRAPISPEVAELLTYPNRGTYDLEIHHIPPMGVRSPQISKDRSRKTILWTMWEWDNFPESAPGFKEATKYIRHYDAVVAYTQQTLDAFSAAGFLGDGQETAVVQGGVETSLWYSVLDRRAGEARKVFPPPRDSRGTFIFAMVGVLAARKNPYAAIKAFEELKDEMGDRFDAKLILKTDFPVLNPLTKHPDIQIITDVDYTDAEMREFYWSIDCLINCSWGEGKDLPAMEATLCGVPTILNDIPGHRGWVHPVMKSLIPAMPMALTHDPDYMGRFTSKDDLKKAMSEAYVKRVRNSEETLKFAEYVEKRGSWEHCIEKLGKKIGFPL